MTDDAPAAPAGWYQDPESPGVLRYWDGSQWSSSPPALPKDTQATQPQAPQLSGSPAFRRLAEQPGLFWGAVLAGLGMAVGAVGTWATALRVISISGTTGEDGQVVLGAAAVGLLALWAWTWRHALWLAIVAAACGAAGAAISGIDLHKLSGVGTAEFFGQQVQLVHAGWGIYLALGAGTALSLLCVALIVVGVENEPASALTGDARYAESRYSAGIGFVVLIVAVGVVIAVSNIGTHTAGSTGQPATTTPSGSEGSLSVPTEDTTSTETTPSPSETTTSPSTGTTISPARPSEPLEAVEQYWADIDAHDFAGAYAYLAPGTTSESQFISGEERAGIQHVEFRGRLAEDSGTGSATVDVVSLVTYDKQFGCRAWSGSYKMVNVSNSWHIEKAALSPRPC